MPPGPDFRALFESAPGRYLVLTPNLTIVAVSEAYLQATMTRREEILGRGLFEVLPDNPDDPHAPGVRNLRESLDRVLQNRVPDTMPAQKCDIHRPGSRGGGFEERYWSLVNSPVFGKDGEIEYILHRVEDVTEFVRLKQLEAEQHRLTEEITARKEAEWKLREFASLADNSPEFIGMCDMNLMPFYVNPAGMRLVGLDSLEQIRRTPVREFLFPEDQRFIVEEFLPRVLREGRAEVEIRMRHFRTGESIWMLQNVFVVRDATGRPTGFATTGRNITERKQADEALRASEERLRLAQEVARVGTFEWNIETGVNTWTPALEAMYGLPRGGFAGTQSAWENLVHPDDRAEAVRRVEYAFETGAPTDGEWRVVWSDGSVHWLAGRWQVFKDESGRPLRMTGINIDITERKQAEEELARAKALLETLLTQAPVGFCYLDRDLRYLLINDRLAKINGLPAAAHLGKTVGEIVPSLLPIVEQVVARILATGGPVVGHEFSGETPLQPGVTRYWSESWYPVRDAAGHVAGFGAVVEEITERKQAEELKRLYVQTRELDRLKTEFFANVSHELRTPLALILGPVRKRLDAGGMTEQERHDLEVVDRNARLLLRHVNDLLDLSKLDAGRFSMKYADVDLARLSRVVASYFEGAAREREIRYTVEIPDSLQAQVDRAKVERVLLNVLSNAFKFTPGSGSVRFAVYRSGDCAILTVEDSDPGIPSHLRDTIFERFRQVEGGADRRFGGTGLGLSIAKEFVGLHGGCITVENGPGGQGSAFRVELPLAAPAGSEVRRAIEETDPEAARQVVEELRAASRAPQPSVRGPEAAGATVLLVEDNPDMNAFIAEALSGTYRVVSAFDGRQGLEKALDIHPDLILCDIMMPRMSGDQLVRELRRHETLDDVPIVLLTAKVDDELRVALLREGAQDYLQKPVSTQDLLAKVGRIITDRTRFTNALRQMRLLPMRLLELRDQERKAIAQELHENVAQYLTAVNLHLHLLQNAGAASDPNVQRSLAEGIAGLKRCTSDVQALSYALHPPLMDYVGLGAAVEWYVREFARRNDIRVRVEFPHDLERLPAEFELTLFRIMEEALTNVCRHSGSRTAKVRVYSGASEVGLEVSDEGCGMPLPDGQTIGRSGMGVGLSEMRERASRLGGRIEIASGSHGTTVKALLPYIREQSNVPPKN